VTNNQQSAPAVHVFQCLLEQRAGLRAAEQGKTVVTTEGDEVEIASSVKTRCEGDMNRGYGKELAWARQATFCSEFVTAGCVEAHPPLKGKGAAPSVSFS
jgi:hypothetical protein